MENSLKSLVLLLVSILSFNLYSAVSYQKGMHTMEFNGKCSDNRPRSKDVHITAIENAKKAAWNNYVAKFSAEKTGKYLQNSDSFTSNLDTYITEYAILETRCSKSKRTYTVALKASINQTMVDVILAQLSGSQGTSSAVAGQPIVSYVIARKVKAAKIFDARIISQSKNETTIDADEDSVSDGSSTSFYGQTTESSKVTTGGSTIRKSDELDYEIGDQTNARNQLFNALKRAKMRPIPPDFLLRITGETYFDDVRKEFAGLTESGEKNISEATRNNIVEALMHPAVASRVKYLLMGTMDSTNPRTDPSSGLIKVDVYITLEISQIDEFFGAEILAVVGPEVRSGLGETQQLAETEALKSAANDAIDSLINRL